MGLRSGIPAAQSHVPGLQRAGCLIFLMADLFLKLARESSQFRVLIFGSVLIYGGERRVQFHWIWICHLSVKIPLLVGANFSVLFAYQLKYCLMESRMRIKADVLKITGEEICLSVTL